MPRVCHPLTSAHTERSGLSTRQCLPPYDPRGRRPTQPNPRSQWASPHLEARPLRISAGNPPTQWAPQPLTRRRWSWTTARLVGVSTSSCLWSGTAIGLGPTRSAGTAHGSVVSDQRGECVRGGLELLVDDV